jgi:oligo-1,6-glucosidase
MGYHFDGTNLGYVPGYFKKMGPYSLLDFKKIYSDWDAVYDTKGWGTIYLGNHDQPRMVSRWGNDSPEFRGLSSKMLTTFLLSMKGTPYYYNGDELGMTNIKFDKIEDYRDIETLAEYEKLKLAGGDLKQFIEDQKTGGARDNGRTPFQWDATKNAGFTSGEPWLKVNNNHVVLNAATEEKDPNSELNYFRKMVKLRKNNLTLVYGKYNLVDSENKNVYAYTRELNGEKLLILLNFSAQKATVKTGLDTKKAKLLITNYGGKSSTTEVRPYEASIFKL